jgi:hypothetical protein
LTTLRRERKIDGSNAWICGDCNPLRRDWAHGGDGRPIFIVRNILGGKAEQIFYAMFLIMIAAFYLAFASYFRAAVRGA